MRCIHLAKTLRAAASSVLPLAATCCAAWCLLPYASNRYRAAGAGAGGNARAPAANAATKNRRVKWVLLYSSSLLLNAYYSVRCGLPHYWNAAPRTRLPQGSLPHTAARQQNRLSLLRLRATRALKANAPVRCRVYLCLRCRCVPLRLFSFNSTRSSQFCLTASVMLPAHRATPYLATHTRNVLRPASCAAPFWPDISLQRGIALAARLNFCVLLCRSFLPASAISATVYDIAFYAVLPLLRCCSLLVLRVFLQGRHKRFGPLHHLPRFPAAPRTRKRLLPAYPTCWLSSHFWFASSHLPCAAAVLPLPCTNVWRSAAGTALAGLCICWRGRIVRTCPARCIWRCWAVAGSSVFVHTLSAKQRRASRVCSRLLDTRSAGNAAGSMRICVRGAQTHLFAVL